MDNCYSSQQAAGSDGGAITEIANILLVSVMLVLISLFI